MWVTLRREGGQTRWYYQCPDCEDSLDPVQPQQPQEGSVPPTHKARRERLDLAEDG